MSEVQGGFAYGPSTLWRSEVAMPVVRRSFSHGCSVSLVRVCTEGCFRIVFESAGSAGVVLGPTLVVGRGIALFRCLVALCSRSVGGSMTFGVSGGGLGGRVVT
ncbi:hypothetical protein Taro_043504, partial [Colocasia esculenta]|nr:hypothetical protein [Colocasia esculenta]